ncbi:MAG: SH3 domain-containing protein [Anaerolineae bacterium]
MKRLLLGLLLLCVMPVLAQTEDCPAFVDVALNTASEMCGGLGRNIACYGSAQIEAAARDTAQAVTFAAPGDTAALEAFGTLTLAPLSLTDETWGIALLSAQASLPDTLPGQNVIFVLFGDVSLTNATETAVEVSMQAGGSANVRLRPGTDAEIIATLTSGDAVTANGRLEDSSWVRIAVFGSSDQYGWVSAPLLNGDPSTLPVVDVDAPPPTQGQSFYFNTGIGDSTCAQAPDSGILLQSPQGAGRVQFTANGVEFSIGSTLYLTSGNGVMTVYVIEGSAMLTAQGTTQAVPAGTYAEIPLDETGQAPAAAPGFPQPYADDAMATLPSCCCRRRLSRRKRCPPKPCRKPSMKSCRDHWLLPGGRRVLRELGLDRGKQPRRCGNHSDYGGHARRELHSQHQRLADRCPEPHRSVNLSGKRFRRVRPLGADAGVQFQHRVHLRVPPQRRSPRQLHGESDFRLMWEVSCRGLAAPSP